MIIQDMESLKDLATEFHIELQKEQIQQFQIYYEYLIEKNKVMNLTTITEKEDVIFNIFWIVFLFIRLWNLEKDFILLNI